MKILIVSQYFWPENMRINELASSLQQRGHQVTVFTGKPNYPAGEYFPGYSLFGCSREQYEGMEVVRIPLLARGRNSHLRLALNYACFAVVGSLLAPFRLRGSFDAILVFAVSPLTQALPALVLKMLGRGLVHIWLLDLWPDSLSATSAVRSKSVLWIARIMSKLIHRAADMNLVCSRGFRERLAALGVSPERIRYLPNFAEDIYGRRVEQNEAARHDALLPAGFRILFAGNVGYAQDFPTILHAAEMLRCERGVQWIIVGDGRASEWLSQEIARRGLEQTVHTMGRFPLEEMPMWYECADAMMVALRSDPIFALTLPGKVQSCMAASKPILAALDGEPARVIQEARCGICVPAGDGTGLAEAALQLSRMHANELRELGLNGRAYFDRHFERQMVIAQLEDCLAAVPGC
jgi:glycosyltransferase involved in cell wall biosynthesis